MTEPQPTSCHSPPSKRQCMTHYTCIIHHESVNQDEQLYSINNESSWETLLNAARVRKFQPLLDLADLDDIPDIHYHRKCRSIFTMKKSLLAIEKRNQSISINEDNRRTSNRQVTIADSRVYSPMCIFCDRVNKYKKGQKTREMLQQCKELRADETLRAVAIEKGDDRMLSLTSRELVAAEAHYHRSCYRNYTRPDKSIHKEVTESEEEFKYRNLEKQAFRKIREFVEEDLFMFPRIVYLNEITTILVNWIVALGGNKVKDSSKKHVRRYLSSEFPSLHFTSAENGRVLVAPDSLSRDDLVRTVSKLQEETQDLKDTIISSSKVSQAAIQIRNDIKSLELQQRHESWPPDPAKLGEDSVKIPSSLSTLIQTVITGRSKETLLSGKLQRQVNSLGQDLIYATTSGKLKTPKHILLPFVVKSLTGNTQLIQILNRFGHSVSYSQMEEIDTAFAMMKIQQSTHEDFPLPSSVKPHVFTTLVWDNIDRLEETLSGAGTSHRINGIAVQPVHFGPHQEQITTSLTKTKRRSINVPAVQLPIYNAGARCNPAPVKVVDIDIQSFKTEAKVFNLLWVLTRLVSEDSQHISAWTGFNITTRDEVDISQDCVSYLPTIDAPATQLSSVHEVLNQTLHVLHRLQLKSIVCVFDQALYAKACEIKWKHSDRFSQVVLRMGVFHTICMFLSIIGKRFQDAGLKDIIIESGVITEGSVTSVLDGKQYNRAVRVHKIMYEAFMRLLWKGFEEWLGANGGDSDDLENTLRQFRDLRQNCNQAELSNVRVDASFQRIQLLFSEYMCFMSEKDKPLSSFWMSYIDMVETLLGLLRATREGNWKLHLASIRSILPWCFAYDKPNYARYLSIYYADMMNLETTHPDIYDECIKGRFSVQLGDTNPFGKIPMDQTIEETINKDTQTPRGTKGFSLKPGALSRHFITAEYRGMCLSKLKEHAHLDHAGFNHPDLQASRIARDEADVTSIVDILENSWINPFNTSVDMDLVGLSSAVLPPLDVRKDLEQAQNVGETSYNAFKKNRLEDQDVGFYHPIRRQNLKTFTSVMQRKKTTTASGKEIILKADKNLFSSMILIAQTRKIDLKTVLGFPLGPIPWSLATPDGLLRKTNKSSLAKELLKTADLVEKFPERMACIIDGMAMVQKINGDNLTFAAISDILFKQVQLEGKECRRIDVVFDVYRDVSIKNAERHMRGTDCTSTHRPELEEPFG